MANYNKVILMGNLTRDPQLSYLPSQTPVVEFGLAINRKWKSQDGEQREETCFVDCKAFGRQAETLNQYMRKGRPILVDGRLQLSQWEDQSGNKRSKLRVVVENFQFLGGGGGGARAASGGDAGGDAGGPPATPQDDFSAPGGPGGDDIPF